MPAYTPIFTPFAPHPPQPPYAPASSHPYPSPPSPTPGPENCDSDRDDMYNCACNRCFCSAKVSSPGSLCSHCSVNHAQTG
ncbi:hypothetical protein M426DRAFT_317468 [Hypoxylon sp. CI-4A]|nr:hypothetical protein M426DRAFT_317468 [Hypoxylon sp. CI-4A]